MTHNVGAYGVAGLGVQVDAKHHLRDYTEQFRFHRTLLFSKFKNSPESRQWHMHGVVACAFLQQT